MTLQMVTARQNRRTLGASKALWRYFDTATICDAINTTKVIDKSKVETFIIDVLLEILIQIQFSLKDDE